MLWRIQMFGRRLISFIIRWPLSLWRWVLWVLWIKSPRGKHAFLRWLAGILLLSFDLTATMLIAETLLDFVKWKTRRLTSHEKELATSIFGYHLPLHLMALDPDSIPVRKNKAKAYVSFYTINYCKDLPDYIFIHELVHVWQFQRKGSVYISESIWAQKWGGGYNYGGLEPLMKYGEGKGLAAFNYEQQADIIEDYFRWKTNMPLQWALNVPGIGTLLEKYKNDLFTFTPLPPKRG